MVAAEWRIGRAACRAQMTEVRRRLESEGVSVDIVFGLEVIDRCSDAHVADARGDGSRPRASAGGRHSPPAGRLIVAAHEDRSVRHLIGWNLRLLGRKIVDRAGETGEHYIAYTREEYRYIWRAAAGGGLMTAARRRSSWPSPAPAWRSSRKGCSPASTTRSASCCCRPST